MNNEEPNDISLKNSVNFLEMNQSFISSNNNNKTEYDYSTKVIGVGEHKSGKTSLIRKALDPQFQSEEYEPTMGFEFFNLVVKIEEKKINMKIWDTCGQEVYRAIVSSFYRGTDLACLVFSLTNRQSFETLEEWLSDLRVELNPKAPIFLIATKNDLEEDKQVDLDEVHDFMQKNNLKKLLITSTKDSSCSTVFKHAAKELYEILKENKTSKEDECEIIGRYTNFNGRASIVIDETSVKGSKKKKKCC